LSTLAQNWFIRTFAEKGIDQTQTEASRKEIAISQDLADTLVEWYGQSLYHAGEDWFFA